MHERDVFLKFELKNLAYSEHYNSLTLTVDGSIASGCSVNTQNTKQKHVARKERKIPSY